MPKYDEIDKLIFEERDTQIFNIPDTKTKLSTLQNYFFPRLEILLRFSLEVVTQVYGVNPYERMTFVYCPSHRAKAKENKDVETVHIGVAAKRGNRPLKIVKANGNPFFFHPVYLTFKVLPDGAIYTELLPFRQAVDDMYVAKISDFVQKYSDLLMPLLSLAHISYTSDISYCELLPLYQALSPEEVGIFGIKLVSPRYYFPVSFSRGIYELVLAFVVLYALAESFICIGEGLEPKIERLIELFRAWYVAIEDSSCNEKETVNESECFEPSIMPDFDSYSFVRAGKWWSILARDQWKCLSCGRSAQVDGVLLEVDHIVPRSKGGTDDVSNLQTLCKKCNVGKSNRDSTNLFVASKVFNPPIQI